MWKSAAAFNLLPVEIIMLLQYQPYSILTKLLQLWIAFALKPVQNAMFALEKAKSLQKSWSSACFRGERLRLQIICAYQAE